jgi:hypothetical protein
MAIRHGIVASAGKNLATAPTVTISSTTNYNQSIATFNGTVSANGAITTTIKFQISTDNSNWSDATGGSTISNTSSQSVSVYYNATGLSVNTLYYVRLVATNSAGTSNSSSTSFTTWNIQVYERSTSGGTTFTIPTVTPTGGSAVSVSIYDIIVFGAGGGGGLFVGGAGGGYQNISSRALSGSRSVTTSVGAGGLATDLNTGQTPTVGGNSTITGDLTTVSASGGGADTGSNSIAPTSGNGNAGGSNASYDPDPNDKTGANNAYGGAGGAGGVGGNGVANASTTQGGAGGIGVSITSGGVTRAGGAGGGGGAFINYGGGGSGSQGANNTYGSGGQPNNLGQAGYIRFRYYAASALA